MKNLSVMVLLVWAAGLVWLGLGISAPKPSISSLAPTAPVAGGNDPQAAAIDGASLALQRLLAPRAADHHTTPLLALAAPLPPPAPIPTADSGAIDAVGEPAPAAPPQRVLSFVYVGGEFRRALVDGQYVHVGTRLADGGRVLDILDDAVVVQDRHGRQVLRIARGPVDSGRAWPARSQ